VTTKIKAHRAATTSPLRVKRLAPHSKQSTMGLMAASQNSNTHTSRSGARADEITVSPSSPTGSAAGPTEACASWQELISPSCKRSQPDISLKPTSAWSEKSEYGVAILAESIDEYEDRVGLAKALEQEFLDSQTSRIKALEQESLDSQAEIRRLEAQIHEERTAFDCLANRFLEMEKLHTDNDLPKGAAEGGKDQTHKQTILTKREASTTRWSRIFSKIMLALERSEVLSRLSWAEHRALLSANGSLDSCNVVKRLKGERIFKQVSLGPIDPPLPTPRPLIPHPHRVASTSPAASPSDVCLMICLLVRGKMSQQIPYGW